MLKKAVESRWTKCDPTFKSAREELGLTNLVVFSAMKFFRANAWAEVFSDTAKMLGFRHGQDVEQRDLQS